MKAEKVISVFVVFFEARLKTMRAYSLRFSKNGMSLFIGKAMLPVIPQPIPDGRRNWKNALLLHLAKFLLGFSQRIRR